MSLPFVPPWRTSAHSNKTLFSLSSTSQVLVPYRRDRSIGSYQQEVSNHADLFSFCLQILSGFVFTALDFLPGLWFQDASVVCLPLVLWNWKLFFFFYPLPAYLCFFPASHWHSVKHRANSVPQNYFSFTVQTFPPHCCLGLMLHIITSAQRLLKGSIPSLQPQSLVPSLLQPLSLIWLHC